MSTQEQEQAREPNRKERRAAVKRTALRLRALSRVLSLQLSTGDAYALSIMDPEAAALELGKRVQRAHKQGLINDKQLALLLRWAP